MSQDLRSTFDSDSSSQLSGAPRSTPNDGNLALSADGVAELTRVLAGTPVESLIAIQPQVAEQLRVAARRLAHEARGVDPVRAERLVVALHAAWNSFPEVRRIVDREARDDLLARLVSICVEEFYSQNTRQQ